MIAGSAASFAPGVRVREVDGHILHVLHCLAEARIHGTDWAVWILLWRIQSGATF